MPEKRNIIRKFNSNSTKNSKFAAAKKQFNKKRPFNKFFKKNNRFDTFKKTRSKFPSRPVFIKTP